MRTVKMFFCVSVCLCFLVAGCSGKNYRGEGVAAGTALGGIAGYFGGRGNLAIAAAGAAGGAILGGAIGMMIDKEDGVYEHRLALKAKTMKLYDDCLRLVEYQPPELALQRYEVYGGNPAYYASPAEIAQIGTCQRMFPEMFAPIGEEDYEEEEE